MSTGTQEWDPFADPADMVASKIAQTKLGPPTATPLCQRPAPLRGLPPVQGRKVRMLCLHGNCSNANITRFQMNMLGSLAKDKMELLYVDGLFESVPSPNLTLMQRLFPAERHFCDFFRYPPGFLDDPAAHVLRTYECIDEAVEYLRTCCLKLGPIDGIWGFSQGANAANIIVAEALAGRAPELAGIRFVVHACAAKPGWVAQRPEVYDRKLQLPALVLGGGPSDKDGDGQPRDWYSIGDLYESPHFSEHNDGHMPFPRSLDSRAQFCHRLIDFACAASGAA